MKANPMTASKAYLKSFPTPENKGFTSEFLTESDEEIIFEHLRFAEQMFPNHGVMLCPVTHTQSSYIGVNCVNILGHSAARLKSLNLAAFFELIHPDDLLHVQHCLEYAKRFQDYDPADLRFVWYYRLRDSQGIYNYIRDEKLAIKTSENTYVHLMLFCNVSEEDKFHHVKGEIFVKRKGTFLKTYVYNPRQEKEITPRQHDIAQLIMRGFSNQEIAAQLGVSVFTIKNHKRMLFKKVNVKNSVELTSYLRASSN